MLPRLSPGSSIAISCVPLGMTALLSGCASNWNPENYYRLCASGVFNPTVCSPLTIEGTVTTPDARAFSLSNSERRLVIEPGRMKLAFVTRTPHYDTSLLFVETGSGAIALKYRQGPIDVPGRLDVVGSTYGQSADLRGKFSEEYLGTDTQDEKQPCEYAKYGYRPDTKWECDKHGRHCTSKTADAMYMSIAAIGSALGGWPSRIERIGFR